MKFIHQFTRVSILLFVCALPAFGQTRAVESFQGREVVAGEVIVMFRATAASARSAAARDDDTASVSSVGRNGAMVIRSRSRKTAELIQAYAGRAEVQYVEPNYVWHKTDVPNESLFAQQWALRNTGQTIQGQAGTPNADIQAVLAWDKTLGSRNVVVGVVDSGIDYTHPDLVDNLWTAPVAFDVTISGQLIHCDIGTHGFNARTRNCDPKDDDGHGTIVSGIIGASGTNGFGVTGVNRVSSLMALKFLDSSGTGTTEDAIAAIEFAIQVQSVLGVNVRVLNSSWGGIGFSQALLDEINSANIHNMLFVTSAGNDSANNDVAPEYPANYDAPNIISVAATDNQDALHSFSNFGANRVHLGAPGVDIESTQRQNNYGFSTGTSMSAAVVSGAAALVLASCRFNTAGLKADLVNTVDRLPSLAGKTISGGRLNVNAAMNSCPGGVSSFDFSANHNTSVGVVSASFTLTIVGAGGFTGAVNLAALSLPAGVTATFNPPQIPGSGSSVMTLSIPPNFTPKTYPIRLFASDGFISKSLDISLLVPAKMNLYETVSATLTATDTPSPNRPGAYSKFSQFTLGFNTDIAVEMRSTVLNPFLYLLSDSGVVMNSDDDSGGNGQAHIGSVQLTPGTYIVEATSSGPGEVGNYFVGINTPTLDSITPNIAPAGTPVTLTFKTNGIGSSAKTAGFPGAQFDLNIIDDHTLTANGVIDPTFPTGIYFVSVSGTNKLPFTVTPAAPVLSSIIPGAGAPGTIFNVVLTGFGFTNGMVFDAGDGFTASLVSTTPTRAVVQFVVSASSSLGTHNVTFSTVAGISNSFPFIVTGSAPTLTSITPNSGLTGSGQFVTITGTNFLTGMTVKLGSGITFSSGVTLLSATQASVQFFVDSSAAIGPRDFVLVTSQGMSNPLPFTVIAEVPGLSSITPNIGVQGFSTNVAITGTGFIGPMTLDTGSSGDITVSNIVISDTRHATATLNISNTATLGNRSFTVTTPGGTSGTQTFKVAAPFPDLTITESPAGTFGQGFMESYNVVVRNIGTAPTSGVTTLTYAFDTRLLANTASGTGAGWSCSTSGSSLVCLMSAPLAAGAQSAITFTISMGTLQGPMQAQFTVTNLGDLATNNNVVSEFNQVVALPNVTISAPPLTLSASQVNLSLSTTSTFPHPLTGKLLLTFVPNPAVSTDDPAMQFSAGGRTVSIAIPANSTQVSIAGNATVGVQSGTVAGVITVNGSFDVPAPSQPKTFPSLVFTIPAAPPVITGITKETANSAVVINMYSNTKNVTSVTFAFSTTPSVLLSCGGVTGCTTSGSSITFDVRSLFSAWYTDNIAYGGASSLRVPFSLGGSLTGNVSVTITGATGTSVFRSFPLP